MGEKLTKTQLSALQELSRHVNRRSIPFWWRRAAMKALAELGLTEGYTPPRLRSSIAYRIIIDAGRAALASTRKEP